MNGRVVVTGGSGFMGGYIVRALQDKGYDVTIFDTEDGRRASDVRFVRGSVTDRELVSRSIAGADAVFHLAGILGTHETVEMAHETANVNILGTLNVLDAARKESASVLYVGKPNYWRNPYTISKIAAEEFCFMYRDEFAMNVRAVRCYNVYGPRQPTEEEGYQKALPTFIVNALRGDALTIYGDGTQSMDCIYVTDAVAAMIAVFESSFAPSWAVDVGSGKEISVNQVAQEVLRLTGSNSLVKHVPMRRGESENSRICADISVLCQNLGFVPHVDFEDG